MARISAGAKRAARERLLETAAQHFARHGFDGANIDAIARAAGFAKGSVYNYFESKSELFGEVLAEACRRTVARYAAAHPAGSLRERLMGLVSADVAVLREEEDFLKVLIREALGFRPETFGSVLEHLEPFLGAVRELLLEGVAQGEIRDDIPVERLALLFVGTLTLLFVQHWGSGGRWPALDEVPALTVTAFLDGAGRRADSVAAQREKP